MNTQKILETYIENIIQIMTPYGSGTGFIIDDLIITNSHVVSGLREVVISAKKVPRTIANVIYDDPYFDLAFIPYDFERLLRDAYRQETLPLWSNPLPPTAASASR